MAQLLSFELWRRQEESAGRLAGLTEDLILQRYKLYEAGFGKTQLLSSQISPVLIDDTVAEKKSVTNLQENNNVNNIDLLGGTDLLTQAGIATGNKNITKAGLLSNSAVKMMKGLLATRGLKGIDKAGGVAGAAGGFIDTADQTLFGELAADNSALTNGLNTGYDAVSSAIMTMGPYGAIIGGAMKLGGLLSDGLTAMGVGTDLMTTSDQILDSKFLKLTPTGLTNAVFAKSTDRFKVDNNVRAQIGQSYGGAYAFMDDAASKAGKKYGLFSSGARNSANRQIGEAKVMLGKISNINKEARDRESIVANTNELLSTNYMYNLSGGIDQRYLRAAKEGGKLARIKKIDFNKKGGQIHNVINLETKEIEWKPILVEDDVPEYKNGGNIEQKCWEPILIEDDSIIILKEGGKSEESKEEPLSNQQNVIPEGALHARKHHMENTEGLTLKGIPVVDDKGEQLAEIELNEIIFNLEVTKKLEELCKDGSDEAAIEAGKLLVQEILFNTEDRTGLISTLKEGGKIEWHPLLV